MIKLSIIAVGLALLSGCATVNTGPKSACFGRTAVDGSYAVTRSNFSPISMSSKSRTDAQDDCDFQNF